MGVDLFPFFQNVGKRLGGLLGNLVDESLSFFLVVRLVVVGLGFLAVFLGHAEEFVEAFAFGLLVVGGLVATLYDQRVALE